MRNGARVVEADVTQGIDHRASLEQVSDDVPRGPICGQAIWTAGLVRDVEEHAAVPVGVKVPAQSRQELTQELAIGGIRRWNVPAELLHEFRALLNPNGWRRLRSPLGEQVRDLKVVDSVRTAELEPVVKSSKPELVGIASAHDFDELCRQAMSAVLGVERGCPHGS